MSLLDGANNWLRQIGSSIRVLKLLALLSLVGPSVFLVFTSVQSRALLLDGTASRASRMSDLLAQHASSAFDAYNLAIARIEEYLRHAPGQISEQALHEYLGAIDAEMDSVDGIVLIGPDWVPIAHSRNNPVAKVSVADREYAQLIARVSNRHFVERADTDLVGRDGMVVGLPVISRYSNRTVLVAVRARTWGDGRMAGAVIMTISPRYFEEIYETLALGGRDRVALMRADSRVLVQAPARPGRPLIDPVASDKPSFQPVAHRPDDRPAITDGIRDEPSANDGIRRISYLRKLEGYPVFVELGYSVDAVLEPWRQQLKLNIAITALATLLLFGSAQLALAKVRKEAQLQDLVLAETRQRAEAEATLIQTQKIEALGQITSGLAHDFNNLLNVVLMNLELAARRLSEADHAAPESIDTRKLDHYLRGATSGAERGVALTRRLLNFAQRQDEEPVELDVSALVHGVRDLLGQAVGSKVRITLDCPATLPAVRAEPNALEAALLNLVVNARDAMPEGGRMQITARRDSAPTARTRPPAPFVVLSVKDTGCGMDPAVLARATEPFFTTKVAGAGSGLGLATVNRFAARAGGKLRLDSQPSVGTSVEIWLPVA